jgi:hypothetical protein
MKPCGPGLVRCNFTCCRPDDRAFRTLRVLVNHKIVKRKQCVCGD